MSAIFTVGLGLYYRLYLRRHVRAGSTLAALLLWVYLCLGVSAVFIEIADGIEPVYAPNHGAILTLLLAILISITGFARFRWQNVQIGPPTFRGAWLIENLLIVAQFAAIAFFLPFAIESLTGDVNMNRLLLDEKMERLAAYGILNTMASAASQLFSSSLVLAFCRLSAMPGQGRNVRRAALLLIASLSYVVYILAYVGRDGVIYWLMTAGMVFLVFRHKMNPLDRVKISIVGACCAVVILVPFMMITISRFFDADQGGAWSIFRYFGMQLINFSDYSSINRPATHGIANFPMFANPVCTLLDLNCDSWPDVKEHVFDLYLEQGVEPWLFGTFVSDLAADFGNHGAVLAVLLYAILCDRVITRFRGLHGYSLARLLLILFLVLLPYWGVFYFRFAISNGYIVVNLFFIGFVALLQSYQTVRLPVSAN